MIRHFIIAHNIRVHIKTSTRNSLFVIQSNQLLHVLARYARPRALHKNNLLPLADIIYGPIYLNDGPCLMLSLKQYSGYCIQYYIVRVVVKVQLFRLCIAAVVCTVIAEAYFIPYAAADSRKGSKLLSHVQARFRYIMRTS